MPEAPSNSDNIIGFYLSLTDKLTPELGRVESAYSRAINSIDRLNTKVAARVGTVEAVLGKAINNFKEVPQRAKIGVEKLNSALGKIKNSKDISIKVEGLKDLDLDMLKARIPSPKLDSQFLAKAQSSFLDFVNMSKNRLESVKAPPERMMPIETPKVDYVQKIQNKVLGFMRDLDKKMPHFAQGGVVGGSKAAGDNIPIKVTAGEGVVPLKGMRALDDLSKMKGDEFFQASGAFIQYLQGVMGRKAGPGEHFASGGRSIAGKLNQSLGLSLRDVGGGQFEKVQTSGIAAGSAIKDINKELAGIDVSAVDGLASDIEKLNGLVAAGNGEFKSLKDTQLLLNGIMVKIAKSDKVKLRDMKNTIKLNSKLIKDAKIQNKLAEIGTKRMGLQIDGAEDLHKIYKNLNVTAKVQGKTFKDLASEYGIVGEELDALTNSYNEQHVAMQEVEQQGRVGLLGMYDKLREVTRNYTTNADSSFATFRVGMAGLSAGSLAAAVDFESSMGKIRRITGASAEELEQFRGVATDAMRQTGMDWEGMTEILSSGAKRNLQGKDLEQYTMLVSKTAVGLENLGVTAEGAGDLLWNLKKRGIAFEDSKKVISGMAKVAQTADIEFEQLNSMLQESDHIFGLIQKQGGDVGKAMTEMSAVAGGFADAWGDPTKAMELLNTSMNDMDYAAQTEALQKLSAITAGAGLDFAQLSEMAASKDIAGLGSALAEGMQSLGSLDMNELRQLGPVLEDVFGVGGAEAITLGQNMDMLNFNRVNSEAMKAHEAGVLMDEMFEDASKSFTKLWTRLKNSFLPILADIGKPLLSVAKWGMEAFVGIASAVGDFIQWVPYLSESIGIFAAVATGIGLVTAAAKAFGLGMNIFSSVLPNAVRTGASAVQSGASSIGTSISSMSRGVGASIGSLSQGIGTMLTNVTKAIGTGMSALGKGLGKGLQALLFGIGKGLIFLAPGLAALAAPPVLIGLAGLTLAMIGLGAAFNLAAPAFTAIGNAVAISLIALTDLLLLISGSEVVQAATGIGLLAPAIVALGGSMVLLGGSLGLAAPGFALFAAASGLDGSKGIFAPIGAIVRSLQELPDMEGSIAKLQRIRDFVLEFVKTGASIMASGAGSALSNAVNGVLDFVGIGGPASQLKDMAKQLIDTVTGILQYVGDQPLDETQMKKLGNLTLYADSLANVSESTKTLENASMSQIPVGADNLMASIKRSSTNLVNLGAIAPESFQILDNYTAYVDRLGFVLARSAENVAGRGALNSDSFAILDDYMYYLNKLAAVFIKIAEFNAMPFEPLDTEKLEKLEIDELAGESGLGVSTFSKLISESNENKNQIQSDNSSTNVVEFPKTNTDAILAQILEVLKKGSRLNVRKAPGLLESGANAFAL